MDVYGLTVEDIRPKNNVQNVGSCYSWYIALKSDKNFKGICDGNSITMNRSSAKSSIKSLYYRIKKLETALSRNIDKNIKNLLARYNKTVYIFLKNNENDLKGTTDIRQIINTIRFQLKSSNEFLTYLYESGINVDKINENIFYYQKLIDEELIKSYSYERLLKNITIYYDNIGHNIALENEDKIENLSLKDLSTLRKSLNEIEMKLLMYASTFSTAYNPWTDQLIFENSDEIIANNQYLNTLFNDFKCQVYVSTECILFSYLICRFKNIY